MDTRRVRLVARSGAGFTFLDTLAAVAITGVLLGVSVPMIGSGLEHARANAAMRATAGFLMAARDAAMTQRRTIEITFDGENRMTATRVEGSTRTTVTSLQLEYGIRFLLQPGVPDTPDAFGHSRAVSFGGTSRAWFLADGSLTDDDGIPVSGTVFLSGPHKPATARAVTVLGATGRVQPYRWDGSQWR